MATVAVQHRRDFQDDVLVRDERVGEKLEMAALNLIRLGEWEVARGHLKALAARPRTRERAKMLLRSLVLSSKDYWTVSAAIPSPVHLSWLALQAYKDFFPSDTDPGGLPVVVEAMIQFQLLLCSCRQSSTYSLQIAKWLCDYHNIHLLNLSTMPTQTHPFPDQVRMFIRSVLASEPSLGHALITSLSVYQPSRCQRYLTNNESLQLLYLEIASECVQQLRESCERSSNQGEVKTDNRQGEGTCGLHPVTETMALTPEKANKLREQVYQMLSLVNPYPEMNRAMKQIEALFKQLLSPLSGGVESGFSLEAIYSCLIGRPSCLLARKLQEVEKVSNSLGATSDSQQDDKNGVLEADRWKSTFYASHLKREHFLEVAMEKALSLISEGRLLDLKLLLQQHQYLAPLQALLLLLGWDRYRDVGSGQKLLDCLWPQGSRKEVPFSQPLLYFGCRKLAFQVELVQWCLDKARPFLPQVSTRPTAPANPCDVFQGLKNHSILYVLHHSTPLSSLNSAEVIDILKIRPDSASLAPHLSESFPTTLPTPFTCFQQNLDKQELSSPSRKPCILGPEQERDITIFQSFCCLKLIMEAIWSSVLLLHHVHPLQLSGEVVQSAIPAAPQRSKVVRRLAMEESSFQEGECASMDGEPVRSSVPGSSNLYQQEVTKRIAEAKGYLSSILPLNYRLEILEDIFSLLFLTTEDILKFDEGFSLTDSLQSSASRSSSGEGEPTSSTRHSLAFICKQHGFLVTERVAGDILELLDSSRLELSATRYSLLSGSKRLEESSSRSGGAIRSAISPGSLQQRVTKLQKQINEAKWRLQLVSAQRSLVADLTQPSPDSLSDEVTSGDESSPHASDDDGIVCDGDASLQQLQPPQVRAKMRAGHEVQRSSDSSSGKHHSLSPMVFKRTKSAPIRQPMVEVRKSQRMEKEKGVHHSLTSPEPYEKSGHCADVEERTPIRKPRLSLTKKKRLRSQSSVSSRWAKGMSSSIVGSNNIVCQMLASPESLLYMCLKHANYSKAREVLKMFSLEGQLGDSLVQFLEQFELVSHDFAAHYSLKCRPHPPPPPPALRSIKRATSSSAPSRGGSLQAVIKTTTGDSPALEGLHRLLTPTSICDMLFAGNTELEKCSQDPLLLSLRENVPALTMLDVLASTKMEGLTAKRIIDMATSRSNTALDMLPNSKLDGSFLTRRVLERRSTGASDRFLQGPLGLLHMLSEVSGYFIHPSLQMDIISSPHLLLTAFPFSLKVNLIMNWKAFCDNYWDARENFEDIIHSSPTQHDILESVGQQSLGTAASKDKLVFDNLAHALLMFPAERCHTSQEPHSDGSDERESHYLWRLGVYLTKFVYLLMRCMGMDTKGGLTPSQTLSVLKDSPTKLIGRLIFEKAISPQTLKQFMNDFPHLKVVEVIVKCCCPLIPSASSFTQTPLPVVRGSIFVLNCLSDKGGECVGEGSGDPCDLSHKLFSKVLSTIKGVCQTDDGFISPKDLLIASRTTEMKKVLSCTSQLASVSLSTLQGSTSRQLAFLCNVVNLLYLHAIITFLQLEKNEETGKLFGGSFISLAVLQSDLIVQTALFSRVGYHIGEMGVVSCFDLHHTILRHGLSSPILDKKHLLRPRACMMDYDPWACHAPSQPDPRVLYVICTGIRSSPIPRLLQPEHVHSELDAAETKFIRATVSFDPSKHEIVIPKLLEDHCNDFIPRRCQYSTGNPFRSISNIALARYILHKLPKEQASELSLMIDACDSSRHKKCTATLTVVVQEMDLRVGYFFSKARRRQGEMSCGESSPRFPRSSSRTRKRKNRTYEAVKPYSFTQETVAFVSEQAPVLASLVCLLCPPELPSSQAPSFKLPSSEQDILEQDSPEEQQPPPALVQTHPFGQKEQPKAFPVKRSHSITNGDKEKVVVTHPSPMWQDTFDNVLSHLPDDNALRRFLLDRLLPFKGILPWEKLIHDIDNTGASGGGGNGDREVASHSPIINLRWLTVLPCQSPEVGYACSLVMRKLLQRGMVEEALKFLRSEPVANNGSHVQFAVDLAVSAALSEMVREETERNACVTLDPLALVYQLSDPELGLRLILPALKQWPVTSCIDLLFFCFHHLLASSSFLPIVQDYLKKLQVCQKVMSVADDPVGCYSKCPWANWSQLDTDARDKPSNVLSLLLGNRAFGVARNWAAVYALEYLYIERIEEKYVHELLEGSARPDPSTAQEVLEDLPSSDIKLKVCNAVLDSCQKLETEVFLLHFMLSKLSKQIWPGTRIQELKNRLMGAKCLLTLPWFIQQQYRPLIAEPLLIVEQLLMDLKIDWAAGVIKLLSEDEHFADIDTKEKLTLEHLPAVLQGVEDSHNNPFTSLLMFYAKKSLEFPLLSYQMVAGDAPGTSVSTRAPSPTVPVTPAAHRPLERLRSPTEPPSAVSSVPATPRHRITSPPMESTKHSLFVPPHEPPTKEEWEPNSKARSCRVCKMVYFNMFSRRHHCRRCGRIVCGPCSGHFMLVRGYDRQQRVCNDCHAYHLLRSGSSEEPVASQEEVDLSSAFPGLSSQLQWVLMPRDPLYNQNQRTEFFYEQSPSTHLCLAIVDLISDVKVGAGFILHCVHQVSQQLVPDSQGRVNEEIDHYFTIGIIQSLLLNSKLRYSQAGDSSGVELCDTYLSRVDLLRLMVSARYKEIPSIQELTKHELARRVRDKLIADDRFELAMEVTTKCQLDTIAVWSAWGRASLRCGDFQQARDKFKHCFQLTSQHSPGYPNHLLDLIIEQLLSCPLALVKIDDWSSMLRNSVQLTERHHDGLPLDDVKFNECCYYLNRYSSSAGKMISFLARNSCWGEACRIVLDKKCSPDVFVECIWILAVRSGHLEQLEEHMKTVDSTLVIWEPYLNCVCKHLSQRGLYHILYHTQLFMKDYIRSGMTCIKFFMGFQGKATTMNDLYSRQRFLNTAKQHFIQAINDKQHLHADTGRRGVRMFGGGARSFEECSRGSPSSKNMTPGDLQSHVRTINLQEKLLELQYRTCAATNTLHRPVLMGSVSGESGHGGQQLPATLFGNGQVRGDLVCHLLTSCQEVDFSENFRLGLDIVSTFRLRTSRVFVGVAKQLAAKESYSQVRQLLLELQKSHITSSPALNDEVCMAAIKVLASQPKETAQKDGNLEKLVQMLNTDKHKIHALMQCGKLKNAYLLAIRANYVEEVQQIADAAAKANQTAVRSFCEKWLQQNRSKR